MRAASFRQATRLGASWGTVGTLLLDCQWDGHCWTWGDWSGLGSEDSLDLVLSI